MISTLPIADPILVGDDEVILFEDRAQVTSASVPGTYYQVDLAGCCECKGYFYSHECRHGKAAAAARVILRRRSQVTCPKCGRWTSGTQVEKYHQCALCMFGGEW